MGLVHRMETEIKHEIESLMAKTYSKKQDMAAMNQENEYVLIAKDT